MFRTIIQALISGILMSGLVTIYWPMTGGPPENPVEIIAQVGIVSMVAFFIAFSLSFMGKRDR